MQADATTTSSFRTITFGPFSVHPERHLLLRDGKPVPIGDRAFEILVVLLETAGELVTKDQLVARAWPNRVIEESNLRVQMAMVRKALGGDRDGVAYIAAVPGRGYRFTAATSWADGPTTSVGFGHRTNNLPTRLTPVIGRADVVDILGSRLKRHRLVTIVGPGGIGKTTVAVATATTLMPAYRDGAWLVDLAALADATLLPSVLAAALGLALTSHDPTGELVSLLRDKHVLIVLDNCERVIDVAAMLAEAILKGAPSAEILATSREALRAEGESVHRLSPLKTPPVAPGLTAASALDFSAVELFIERVESSVDGFRLSDTDAPVAAEICRQLDGIALAIELAAARVSSFGLRGVAERLGDRFRILVGGRRTALPRHQTLAATLDWSYALLDGRQQTLLRRLGAFAGGFTLESACCVGADAAIARPDVPGLLSDLIEKSLVSVEADASTVRYRLLDTMRAYTLAKLSESTECAAIQERHAEHFRDLFEQSLSEWQTRPTNEWLRSYSPEADNVRLALDWAFSSTGNSSVGTALTVAAIPLWFQLSSTDECRNRVEHALAMAGPVGTRADHARHVMQLYAALGLSRTFTMGLAPQASAAWEKAFDIAESLEDREFELEALWGMWFCRLGLGEYRLALDTAREFCRRAVSPSDLALADRMAGVPLHCLGDGGKARTHIEQSLSREVVPAKSAESIRFRFNQPLAARVMLAQMLWLEGFPDRALVEARNGVEEARAGGHAISLCDALAQAACPLAIFTGGWLSAQEAVAELLDEAAGHALDPWRVIGQCWSAALQVKQGKFDPGLMLLEEGLASLRQVRFAFFHTGFICTLAEGLAMSGHAARALKVIDEALKLCEQREELWCVAEHLRVKGEILLQLGDPHVAEAEDHFERSLEHAVRQRALSWQLRTAISLARLRITQGRQRQARKSLAAVYGRFHEGFATRDLRMAKSLIDELS
jgi:predicted ATPase/DNA-binding winged helix-turn-helix (wHTH) protein